MAVVHLAPEYYLRGSKMAKKYKYIIWGRGYGGELVIGKSNEGFVRYWQDRVEDDGDGDLIDALTDWEQEFDIPEDALEDPDGMPSPMPDGEEWEPGAWHDLSDIEQISSTFADSWCQVVPVLEDDTEDDENAINIDLNDLYCMYSREAYHDTEEPDWDNVEEEYIPIVTFFSSEKGQFWNATLELDEPFDKELLAVSNLETNMAELTTGLYYDGKELDLEYDYYDTTGKGYHAGVGWMCTKWHDKEEYYSEPDRVEEMLNDFKDHLEWVRQEQK